MKATLQAPGTGEEPDTLEEETRDEEAWRLLKLSRAFEAKFPGVKDEGNRAKLAEYRDLRQKRGEQPFQYLPGVMKRKQAEARERAVPVLGQLFAGPDAMAQALPEPERAAFEEKFRHSLDPARDKMQAANKLAVEQFTGKPAESFGEAWPIVRSQVANKLWNTRGVVDEAAFYSLAGKHFKQEQGKLDERNRMRGAGENAARLAEESAITGNHWFDGWNDSLASMSGAEGFTDSDKPALMKVWRRSHRKTARDFETVAPAMRKVFATMQKVAGQKGGGEAFADLDEAAAEFAKIPESEFPKAVVALSVLAERGGQDVESFFGKLGESLDRGMQGYGVDLSTGQAGRLAADVLRKIEAGDEILVPVEMAKSPEDAAMLALSAGAGADWQGSAKSRQMDRRPLKPMEREMARQFAQHMTRAATARQAIKDHREIVARTRSENAFVQGLYDATESIPYTVAAFAGPTGMILNASVMAEQNFRKLKHDHPGVPDAALRDTADAAGYLQSLEETVLTKVAFGRFKGLQSAMAKVGAGKITARFGMNAAVATAVEFTEEKLQQATLPAVQEILGALGKDVPAVNWDREWKQIAGGNTRLFFAVLPLSLIGAGAATHSDIKGYREITENRKVLEAAKLSPESINTILAERDPAKRDVAIQEAYRERDAAAANESAAVEQAGGEAAPLAAENPAGAELLAEVDFWEEAQRRGAMPEIIPQPDGTQEVRLPDGSAQVAATAEEAAMISDGWMESQWDQPENIIRGMPDESVRANREFLEGDPIVSLSGEEFAKEDTPLPARVAEHWKNAVGDSVTRADIGEVSLGPRGIVDSWRHGRTAKKAAVFAAVPDIIRDGVILERQPNYRGGTTERIVLAAPISIAGEGHIAAVVLKRDANTQRFYVHDAWTREEVRQPPASGTGESQRPGTAATPLRSIVFDALRVNSNPDATPSAVSEARLAADEFESTNDSIFDSPTRDASGKPVSVPLAIKPHPAFGDPVSAPEVIEELHGVLEAVGSKTPIRVGKVKRTALGSYYVRAKMIRLRSANDISTAAHEVAHALEDAMFGAKHNFARDKSVPKAAKAELHALGVALYGSQKPVGGYHSEGFAEFIRMIVEGGHAHAAASAPEFSKWFEANIMKPNPKLAAAIDASIEAAARWNQQGSLNRAKQSIAAMPTRVARMREAGAEFIRTLGSRFVDMAFPLKAYVQEAQDRAGASIPTGENPWDTLNARRLSHDAVASYMVEHGMLDFAGNRTGKSLAEVLAPVQGKQDEFLIYLWARRTMALKPDGRNSGLSHTDAAEILTQLDSPAFQLAAQGVYDWNNGVLEYAAQSSPDFAQVVKLIRDADPGQYIPLFREFKAFDERYRKLATDAKSGQLVKRLKGSGRRIKNPVESMIAQARALVLKSQQKAILDQIIRIADTVPGLGDLVFEIQPDQVPGAARETEALLQEVARTMKANGASQDMNDAMKAAMDQLGMENADVTEAMLTFWVPAQTPKAEEDPIVPIYNNGKRRWFEVSRGVYEAINGMEVYRLPRVLDLFLGVPTRTLRLGTTGLRASFSLITNPLRDFRTLHLNSQTSANSGELFFEWMRGMGAGLLDVATAGKVRSEWIDLFERLGGSMAMPLGQDVQHTARASKRLFSGRTVRTLDPRNWMDFARDMLQFPEKASRIAEMKLLAKDIGWDFSMPLDTATAARLITAAKQVTTDFTAAGNVARVMNQCMPFFNAQIQGPRAHIRAIQRSPGKFAIRGLMGTALALALWFRYRDEDWWKEMPESEKYGYTYFPFDGPDGSKELLRIPRAFEADGVFMAGAQALADAWHQKEPDRAAEWFEKALGNFAPSAPPMFKDIYEQAKNKSTFTGAPIVPRGEQDLAPEEQFGPSTTSLAIKLGDLTGQSPRRIDHSIRSYFGGVGTDVASVFGRGESGNRIEREGELADLPVIGTVFQRGGQASRSASSIESMYERLDFATKRQRSRKEPESPDEEKTRLLLTDATRAVAYVSDVIRLEWSVKERRKLEATRVEIAREAVKAFDANATARAKFTAWRKQWEDKAAKAEKDAGMSR